ncbi:AAA domain-containing protein [Hirsutella rhossiliensis]|uniref:AAA domain-containing protein n=1 Tax=Hirsutella rhossiliensis TaxID=111463 RepID=A0A9P8SDS5_9HYPO|nr:AAA domain-containing protein [Hirsutella rhossiliensis]KAH0959058.1 AAA domain-containing protein [Hirsutella rhossiliensis]
MELPSRSQIIAQHVQRSVSRDTAAGQPQEWHRFPELPLAAELMADESPDLLEVVEMRPVPKYDYLEAQYRLHRYEATEMLRKTIVQFRQDPAMVDGDDASVFTEVYVRGIVLTRAGPACRAILSMKHPRPERPGSQADCLMPGSLVALTPRSDSFRTKCFVATVANRFEGVDTRPPVVELFWADEGDAVVDPTLELVMLEPKGQYFESIRHTMTGLQHAVAVDSKFDKYIHQASTRHQPAAYLRETPYNAAVVPDSAQQLDPSQLEALKLATSQELAVIQGPPGTGKTFASIVAIESYVRTMKMIHGNRVESATNPVVPIIVAAQTNHAVDQILERCVRLEIGSVARLGRRSQVELINERNLSNIVRRSKACRPDGRAEASLRGLRGQLRVLVQQCLPKGLLKAEDLHELGIITENQLNSLTQDDWETEAGGGEEEEAQSDMAKWLDEYIQQRDYRKAMQRDAETQPKAEQAEDFLPIDMTRPDCILRALHRDDGDVWWHKAERLLARTSDLYRIKPTQRGAVYCYLYKSLFAQVTAKIQRLFGHYQEVCNKLKMTRWENNIKAMHAEGVQILGCTTTGLVKYRGMLAALKPRILLVEEAAETREANIAAALLPSLEQLVLVGDHQQLVPHADMRELCRAPHRLTVSLFQRLVNIKVPYCALRVQRRMIPAIREVVQVFYPNLEDHDVVKDPESRPPVPGMGDCSLWWFHHQWVQSRGDGGFSYSNHKEATMVVGFARYLVQSGVAPEQITALAYYTGQVELIKSKLRQDAYLGALEFEWSVRTIDGFQGEENDIILLSLVRGPDSSRSKAMPGFVADENRAVVATSRAKRGFYIFGNAQNVLRGNSRSRQTWEKVVRAFQGRTASHLPLTCAAHGTGTKIFQPEDWRLVTATGCLKRCDEKPPSGPAFNMTPLPHPPSGALSSGSEQAQSDVASMADAVKAAMRYQTSDDLMEGGMRKLFAKYDAAAEVLDDLDVSSSESGSGLLISLGPE